MELLLVVLGIHKETRALCCSWKTTFECTHVCMRQVCIDLIWVKRLLFTLKHQSWKAGFACTEQTMFSTSSTALGSSVVSNITAVAPLCIARFTCKKCFHVRDCYLLVWVRISTRGLSARKIADKFTLPLEHWFWLLWPQMGPC